MDPFTCKTKTEQALEDIRLANRHQILKNFGVQIRTILIDAAAKVLFPPAIQYGNGSCQPKGDFLPWQLRG